MTAASHNLPESAFTHFDAAGFPLTGPFSLGADGNAVQLFESFADALAALALTRLSDRDGIALLVGPEGAGKTTLVGKLLEQPEAAEGCLVVQGERDLTFSAYLRQVASGFGRAGEFENPDADLKALSALLVERGRSGRSSLVIVEQAERLSRTLLQELDAFSNWTRAGHRLCHVVLVVRGESQGALGPAFQGLKAAWRINLKPLDAQEVARYIAGKLAAAQAPPHDLFVPDAAALIAKASKGRPGEIDRLAALALAHRGPERRPVDRNIVRRALTGEANPTPSSEQTSHDNPPAAAPTPARAASRQSLAETLALEVYPEDRDAGDPTHVLERKEIRSRPLDLPTSIPATAKPATGPRRRRQRRRRPGTLGRWAAALTGLSMGALATALFLPDIFGPQGTLDEPSVTGPEKLVGLDKSEPLSPTTGGKAAPAPLEPQTDPPPSTSQPQSTQAPASSSQVKTAAVLVPGPDSDPARLRQPLSMVLLETALTRGAEAGGSGSEELSASTLSELPVDTFLTKQPPGKALAPLRPPQLILADASGPEDVWLVLPITVSADNPQMAAELELSFHGVPSDARLSAGRRDDAGLWHFVDGEWKDLRFLPPPDAAGRYHLDVIASVTRMDGQRAVTKGRLPVEILATADRPALELIDVSGNEGKELPLRIVVQSGDRDGSEHLDLYIDGLPAGSRLSAGREGPMARWHLLAGELEGLTLTPPRYHSGISQITVTAISREEDESVPSAHSKADFTLDIAPQFDSAVIADLVRRGDELLELKDIAAARLFYEQAALRGDPGAMTALGTTYDPIAHRKLGLLSIGSDRELARHWYELGGAAGDLIALDKLKALSEEAATP